MSSKSATPKQPAKLDQAKTGGDRAEGRKADRLAAALRDNLKRRKTQRRARDGVAGDRSADESEKGGDA